MKNKKKFLLPVMAFMLAVAAAFAGQKSERSETSLVNGYIHQGTVCEQVRMCSTTPGIICTYGGQQVFGLTAPNVCQDKLYLPK